MQAQDWGQDLAKFRGTKETFPDPRGTLKYVIDGETYTWQGRGRQIGLTIMNPGDQIEIYFNPMNPREINTLVLLGASTGNTILAGAIAFLVFYVWFFWLRGFYRNRGPDGAKAASLSDLVQERPSSQMEQSRFVAGDHLHAAINKRPTGKSLDRARGATFGKR